MAWTFGSAPRAPLTRKGARNSPVKFSNTSRSWRELCHPDLAGLSDLEFEIRSSILSRLLNGLPQSEWIGWYGGMRRTWPGGDLGNGAYMTEAQAEAWKDRTDMGDIKAGPG